MEKKLFMVEMGKPHPKGYGTSYDPLMVVARSFDEAERKAVEHLINEEERNTKSNSVLNANGDLVNSEEDKDKYKFTVKNISIAAENIIW